MAAVLIGSAGLMGCSSSSDEATGPTTSFLGDNPAAGRFYQPPDPLPAGDPGDIIRSEPLDGAPAGSRAWRVLYHSTGLHGEDIAVSGMVFAPDGSSSSSSSSSTTSTTSGATTTARSGDASDHPVVAWAHPTTGVADTCAPSVLSDGPSLVAGLDAFLDAGFVVAATDYQGLGTPGLHPYLIGESEGRGTLDAVRAARQLDDAHAGTTVFTWGHSQGGQAALFAGQMAADYAPELDLAGVAAAAPAGELAEVFDLDENTVDGIALGGWAMNAFYEVYKGDHSDMDLDQMVTRAASGRCPAWSGCATSSPASTTASSASPRRSSAGSTPPTTRPRSRRGASCSARTARVGHAPAPRCSWPRTPPTRWCPSGRRTASPATSAARATPSTTGCTKASATR